FIQKLNLKTFFSRPRILICCPTNITSVEQKAIREVAEKSGGKQVFLEEEPKVAAIGAGMEIFEPSGNMIIDIGGGTADVAVLSMGDIVTSQSVKVAGNKWDADILNYVKRKYNLLIGERTAENIKVTIGTACQGAKEEKMEIRGRDLVSGLPKTISITSSEVEEAIHDSLHLMVLAAKQVLEQTPPELSADIIDRGIIMTGGGSLLHGLDELMSEQLKVPVLITENPLDVVALGTGILLDSLTNKKRNRF
ncbi:TPA: rod shape-determining protein MreB, partial [Listeria monocytogenes]|nr:rod shape-determining protein MreB [Listeria monocytogenes]